ncbi:MAG: exo-alpha-sialidase, partial [Anaerolineae bacterium]|nr:exo-alpha-sialidase [Anaerolineae bacterium]
TYLASVASRDDIPGATEGPNETSLVRLADGDIMAVMRVGSGVAQPLVKTYSGDGGRTWSRPERLPAYSVAPCLRRLQNGVLALSTGRPGIYLWLSADPRGDHWESFDILGYHNDVMGPAHQMRPGQGGHHATDPYQTTAYTVMAETTPNRLLLTYDRIPFGWNPVPLDSDERNRIYVLTIDVERE